MEMKTKFLIGLLVVGIVLVSGCIQQGAESVCGNGVVEAGEECDGDGCPTGKVCTENCKCEILLPPALPED